MENNKKLYVIKENCPGNHSCPCSKICPVQALSQVGFAAPVVDEGKCIKCGLCATYCPRKALELR